MRADKMAPAVQLGDRSRFRPQFLAAIDWALAPFEDQRPQSVAEWRAALLGVSVPEVKTEKLPPKTEKLAPQLSKEVLARAELALAEYLGPVARVVVKRAAAKARDERELYLEAFVRKGVSISGKP